MLLLFNISYKKEIPVFSMISYLIVLVLFDILFNQNIIIDIKNLITSEFIFGVILIATIPMFSPIKDKEKIIYSILIGILSFIFNKLLNIIDGVFIAIFITDIIMIGYKKLERIVLNEHK